MVRHVGTQALEPIGSPDADATPSASVVICTYTAQRWEQFETAVESLRDQVGPGDQIVVVVDHNDPLLRRIHRRWPEGVDAVANTGDQGLSDARNTGIAVSAREVVLFLDDDAVPAPGWLESYLRRFADPAVVAVGGAVTPLWDGGEAPRWFPREFGWVVGCDYTGLPENGDEIRNPIGASMGIRRSAFDRVGGFSPVVGRVGDKPVGCEETDLCIRIRQDDPGAVILRDTDATVRHFVPRARQTLSYFVRRCWHEGRSKAVLASRVGTGDGLSSERVYLLTLLRGMFAGVRAAPRDPVAPLRSLVIPLGAMVTALGYFTARRNRAADPGSDPVAGSDPVVGSAPADSAPSAGAAEHGWVPLAIQDYDADTAATEMRHPFPDGGKRLELLVFRSGAPVGIVPVAPAAVIRKADVLSALDRQSSPGDESSRQTADESGTGGEGPPTSGGWSPAVSVVVPTAGRAEQLRRCVDSLLAQTYPDLEIVVVDNNRDAGDASRILAADIASGRVTFLHQPDGGSSEARNVGIRRARGELIAQTDDDVVAHPEWVARLVAEFDSPEVALVTGLVVPLGYDTRAQELFEEYGGFGKGFVRRRFDLHENRGESRLYPFAAGLFGSGNNVAYRASVARRLHGYDPLLGPGSVVRAGQDLDFFLRVLLGGGTIVYTPGAVVRHEHRRTMAELERQLHNYGRGLSAVMLKTGTSNLRTAALMAVRLPIGVMYLLNPASGKNSARSRDYPKAMKQAELRGFAQGGFVYVRARLIKR